MLTAKLTNTGIYTYFIYGPTGAPLAEITGTAVVYHHNDQQGSTRATTDTTGAINATWTYDPYGATLATTDTPNTQLLYTAQHQDPETGFYYLRARHYDPTTGQLLSRDPIEALTRSAYGYTRSNPLNATDPSGLYCISLSTKNGQKSAAQEVCNEAAEVVSNAYRPVRAAVVSANPISGLATGASGIYANVRGADCGWNSQEWVTVRYSTPGMGQHSATWGLTVVSGFNQADFFSVHAGELAHEAKHVDQWMLGSMFTVLYGLDFVQARKRCPDNADPGCYSFFEWWAGRGDVGYTSC